MTVQYGFGAPLKKQVSNTTDKVAAALLNEDIDILTNDPPLAYPTFMAPATVFNLADNATIAALAGEIKSHSEQMRGAL